MDGDADLPLAQAPPGTRALLRERPAGARHRPSSAPAPSTRGSSSSAPTSTCRRRSPRSARTARRRSCRTAGCARACASSTAARARCSRRVPSLTQRDAAPLPKGRCDEGHDPALLPGPRLPQGVADPGDGRGAGRRPADLVVRRDASRARRATRRLARSKRCRRGCCCRSVRAWASPRRCRPARACAASRAGPTRRSRTGGRVEMSERARALDAAAAHARRFLESLTSARSPRAATRKPCRAALGGPLSVQGEDPEAVIDALAAGADPGHRGDGGAALLRLRHRRRPAGGARRRLARLRPGTRTPAPRRSRRPRPWSRTSPRGWLLDLLGLPATASVGFVTGGRWRTSPPRRRAPRGARARRVGRRGSTGSPARRRCTCSSATRRTSRFSADAPARARPRAAIAGRRRRAGPDAMPTRSRRRSPTLDGPDDRLRAGGQREHRRLDPFDAIADVAPRARCLAARRRRLRPVGRGAPRRAHSCDGIERADSWATDAHKWLNVPYDSGLAIVRDPRRTAPR